MSKADPSKLGVQFGILCKKLDIPVADVAEHFGITKPTVYNWFKGITNVPPAHYEAVAQAVKKLQEKA